MIRAKMQVQQVVKTLYSETVKLTAVCGGTPEDNSFSKATPCASMEMTIDNPDAQGKLVPGKNYYLDFTPADE
jgi:hypothetical protein